MKHPESGLWWEIFFSETLQEKLWGLQIQSAPFSAYEHFKQCILIWPNLWSFQPVMFNLIISCSRCIKDEAYQLHFFNQSEHWLWVMHRDTSLKISAWHTINDDLWHSNFTFTDFANYVQKTAWWIDYTLLFFVNV